MTADRTDAAPWGLTRAWNGFFFTPGDPRPLAAARIMVGMLLVWSWWWLGWDLEANLGAHGWADPDVVRQLQPPGAWSLWFAVPEGWLRVVWVIGLVGMVFLTLGLMSRVAAWVSWVFVVSTMRRAPVILFGFDNVIAIWTLYLAVSFASGQAYSLDRLIFRRRSAPRPAVLQRPAASISANLGLRLIQLHLCLIYASAGLAKLQGAPWWDGSAVGMLLGNSEFRPFDLTFLAEHPALLEWATHATVALELLYPVLIWSRGFRPWLLLAALLMHVGIALSMGLTEFSLVMLAGNLAFVPARWFDPLEGLFGRGKGPGGVESKAPPADQPRANPPRGRSPKLPRRQSQR